MFLFVLFFVCWSGLGVVLLLLFWVCFVCVCFLFVCVFVSCCSYYITVFPAILVFFVSCWFNLRLSYLFWVLAFVFVLFAFCFKMFLCCFCLLSCFEPQDYSFFQHYKNCGSSPPKKENKIAKRKCYTNWSKVV